MFQVKSEPASRGTDLAPHRHQSFGCFSSYATLLQTLRARTTSSVAVGCGYSTPHIIIISSGTESTAPSRRWACSQRKRAKEIIKAVWLFVKAVVYQRCCCYGELFLSKRHRLSLSNCQPLMIYKLSAS